MTCSFPRLPGWWGFGGPCCIPRRGRRPIRLDRPRRFWHTPALARKQHTHDRAGRATHSRRPGRGAMRKLVAWGLEVALVVGLGAAVARADDAPSGRPFGGRPKYWKKSNNGWVWQRGSNDDDDDEPTAKPKKDAPAKKPAKDEAKPDPKPGPELRDPAAERAREEAVFLRRSAVCLRLQEIGLRNNDAELMKKAEQLRERAWSAY